MNCKIFSNMMSFARRIDYVHLTCTNSDLRCTNNKSKFISGLNIFTLEEIKKEIMKRHVFILSIVCSIIFASCGEAEVEKNWNNCKVSFKGKELCVNTGKFERIWELNSQGLVTKSLRNVVSGKQWVNTSNSVCDWAYFGLIDQNSRAKLLSVKATESTDSGFTSPHILVEAEFEYTELETFVKFEIRVYPNAEGVFTRVALKGNPSKYMKSVPKNPGITFQLVNGEENYNYKMHSYTDDYIANYTYATKNIEYLIEGLDKHKKYKIGMSWWDFENEGGLQDVIVSSVDGEINDCVLAKMKVSSYKNREKPIEVKFDLPPNVLLDGSFRLKINKAAGKYALLSEIWIEEEGNVTHSIVGNTDRVSQRQSLVAEGFNLAGYHNCGERNKVQESSASGRVDFLPVDGTNLKRRYIGYYNDTQHRNKRETPLIKEVTQEEQIIESENVEWASILMLEDQDNVLISVKESHKCVNQFGYDTGDFEVSKSGISSTGTSLMPEEILPDRYRYCWASWVIASKNGEDERELALKRFERIRFPVNPETDTYIIANTWGSDRGINASTENNVMVELQSQYELGIDVQQIDDGWQKNLKGKFNGEWYPSAERFPNGFGDVRGKADSLGLKLGLWFAAQPVDLKAMKDNFDLGGFSYYKLDFANLRNHNDIEKMVQKIRAYELYTNHKSKVNWDVTENAPRFGYFWAKEYGCVFLENRKPKLPENVVYTPYLVLRDLWHLSKYCNLNKFQGSVQNIDMVDKEKSDAFKYNHPYSAAIPLMSTPLFFQETQFYTPRAKEQIKTVLSAYRKVREDIYQCFVYPIGYEPDNASWAGFQAHHPEKQIGYISLFREIDNREPETDIKLRFLKDKKLSFKNLLSDEIFEKIVDEDGNVSFTIPENAGFLFLKYEY